MRFITSLLLLAIVSACTVPYSHSLQPVPMEATFVAPKDAVWAAVMSEVAVNYRVQTLDRESGFLGIEVAYIPIGSERPMTNWVFMPNVMFGTWETLSMTMNILVEEQGADFTKVTVRADFHAFETSIYQTWIPCESNGQLEQMVLMAIDDRLSAK